MFGSKERPYPAHVLISFWCDSDNKNLIRSPSTMSRGGGDLLFLLSPPAAGILFLLSLENPYSGLFPNSCSMHTGPGEFAW